MTPGPRTGSRRSARRTPCSPTRRSASSTTRCAGWAPSAASVAEGPRPVPGPAGPAASRPSRASPSTTSRGASATSPICSARSSTWARRAARSRDRGEGGRRRGRTSSTSWRSRSCPPPAAGRSPSRWPSPRSARPATAPGRSPGTQLRTCSECGGSGHVSFGQGGFAVKRPCPACFGRGKIPETPCPSCDGRGTVRQKRKIQINVPAGVETGSKVRLSGQGERGRGGGPAGDLIITFKVQPHRFFRREGLDIHVTVPINIVQATLGSKIRVRTIHGKKVVLKIPPGTQTGTKFRIRGQGVEKGERVGDQYVEVQGRGARRAHRGGAPGDGGVRPGDAASSTEPVLRRSAALTGCRRRVARAPARTIRPPPRTRSPSKTTADWPGRHRGDLLLELQVQALSP